MAPREASRAGNFGGTEDRGWGGDGGGVGVLPEMWDSWRWDQLTAMTKVVWALNTQGNLIFCSELN